MHNCKSRYICRKHLLSNKIISIDFVKSNKNITDPLTKGLSRELLCNSHIGKICLKLLKDEKSIMMVTISS
jgi:hypothetical protein